MTKLMTIKNSRNAAPFVAQAALYASEAGQKNTFAELNGQGLALKGKSPAPQSGM